MPTKKLRTERIPDWQIIRGALTHYTEFRELFNDVSADPDQPHKQCILEHSYVVFSEDGTPKEKVSVSFSYWDLLQGVEALSARKKEAIWHIAIMGNTQEAVSQIMNCRPVTCGQYLKAGCMQLAKENISEEVELLS